MSSDLDFSDAKGRGLATSLALAVTLRPAAQAQRMKVIRPSATPDVCRLELGEIRDTFELQDDQELARLHVATVAWLGLAKRQQRAQSTVREHLRSDSPLQELSPAALDSFYSTPAGPLTRRDRRGLEELQRLSALALGENDPALRQCHINLLAEVAEALNHNHPSLD